MKTNQVLQLAAMVAVLGTGCANKQSEPEPSGPPPGGQAKIGVITAAECEAQGGQVVGDIGDGAIYKADYTCANGKRPIAGIEPAAGEPIAVEGSVCCAG